MIFKLYTVFCYDYIAHYYCTRNARLVSAPNEAEAKKIYRQAMKDLSVTESICIEKIDLPYGYIGCLEINGKSIPPRDETI